MKPATVIFALALFAPGSAQAFTLANLADLTPGARSALLGGAAVALGQDDGMLWLNPAGIARVDRTTLGIGLCAFGATDLRVAGFFRNPSGRNAADLSDDGRSTTTQLLPSSIGALFELGGEPGQGGHQVIGFGVLHPFAAEISLAASDHLSAQSDRVLAEQFRSLERNTAFGAGWALELDERWSIGGSLFANWTTSSSTQMLSNDSFDRASWAQATLTQRFSGDYQDWTLVGTLGVQWRGPDLSIGASIQLPPLLLDASGGGHGEILQESSNRVGTRAVLTEEESRLDRALDEHTVSFSLGVAIEPIGGLRIELDGTAFGVIGKAAPLSYTRATTTLKGGSSETQRDSFTLDYHSLPTFNLAIGAELQLEGLVILGGFFTDRATWLVPKDDAVLGSQSRNFDRLGGSLGIGFGREPGSAYAGLRYTHGEGNFGAFELTPKGGSISYALAGATEERLLLIVGGTLGLGGAP